MYNLKTVIHRNTVKEVRDILETENLRVRQCSDNGYLWHCLEYKNFLAALLNEASKGVHIEYIPLNNSTSENPLQDWAPSPQAKIVIHSRDNPQSRNLESKITKTLDEAGLYEVVSNESDDAFLRNLVCSDDR